MLEGIINRVCVLAWLLSATGCCSDGGKQFDVTINIDGGLPDGGIPDGGFTPQQCEQLFCELSVTHGVTFGCDVQSTSDGLRVVCHERFLCK